MSAARTPTEPPVGTRIVAQGWAPSPTINDNITVPPGTVGTVTGHGYGQIWVDWDNGARLALVVNGVATPDRWAVA